MTTSVLARAYATRFMFGRRDFVAIPYICNYQSVVSGVCVILMYVLDAVAEKACY